MRLYFSRVEQYTVVVLLLAIVGALFVLSYAYGRKQRELADVPLLEQMDEQRDLNGAGAETRTNEIAVHVTGAVKRPGLYRFFPGARIDDAIRQAGGPAADGYPDALNLAARLQDGARVAVPTRAEWEKLTAKRGPPPLVIAGAPDPMTATPVSNAVALPPEPATAPGETPQPAPAAHAGPKPLPSGKVHLNTATREDLMTLPGVGPVTAQHILEYRQQQGKFDDLAQLLDVPGIGPKTFEKLNPYVEL